MEFIKLCLLFMFAGCFFEVFFTSAYERIHEYFKPDKKVDVRFFGYWSVLYAPFYGLILPLIWIWLFPNIESLPFFVRGLWYGILFIIGEMICMYILRKIFGKSPSEDHYNGKYFSVKNLTRLDYFPFFVIMGFMFESIYNLYF